MLINITVVKRIKKSGKCSDKECALKEIEIGTKAKICNDCYEGLLEQFQTIKKKEKKKITE